MFIGHFGIAFAAKRIAPQAQTRVPFVLWLSVIAIVYTSLVALVESLFPYSGNVAVLEQPLHPVSLITAVRVGMRARHRQLEVRHLLEQRDDALRKRDEFLAMLAHELRNPLAPLRNAVYILRQVDLQEPILHKTRDLIDRQTAHLKRLVDDLLDVSRLELGKINLHKKPLDLNESIEAAAESCHSLATAHRHRLEVRLAEGPLTILADPVRLEQVVCNLVTNAIKFTPDGGSIVLETSRDEDTVCLIVRDNGIGLRADMLGAVFDLFTQDHRTLERAGGGLGIGLTLVKRLVELHGGSVSVVSEGPDQGSAFTIRFPQASPAVDPPQSRSGDGDETQAAKRVLVVEDSTDIRDSLGEILRMWGHQVEFASTGTDGLMRARDLKPDAALIDIGLPELNGYDVARAIRSDDDAWSRSVLLVALTGYGRDSDRARAIDAGFDRHLVKPVDPQVLAKTLDECRR